MVRYFMLASLSAILLAALALTYFGHKQGDFFQQLQREQNAFFAHTQDLFAKQQSEAARRNLLTVYEAGSVNLGRLFSNTLWPEDFAPFVAKVEWIAVDQCRAIADVKDADGKGVHPDGKRACFTAVGKQIMALPEFQALNLKVYGTMKKSTVFKIKVFDKRGITAYSSEHSQIGEDKTGNVGWKSAVAGRPASELTFRGRFSTSEGDVENRDVISSYLPVFAPGGEKIVGVFEIYSDVTPFIQQIAAASLHLGKLNAENRAQLDRVAAASQIKLDESEKLRLAIVLVPLVLLYLVLLLVVRNGQRVIDRQDIDRRRAEERLLLQGAALDAAANAIVITDRDGTIRWVNRAFSVISGFSFEEVIGQNPRILKSGQQGPDFYRRMFDTLLHGSMWQGEIVNRHKDGHLVWEELTITPILRADGEITNYIAIKQDITVRKEADMQRARLSAILEASPDFVATTDPHGKVLYYNNAARRLLELPQDFDPSQCSIFDIQPRWAAQWVRESGIPGAVRDGVWSGETVLLSRGGAEIPVIQVILAHKSADGSVAFLSTIARDITERKAAETALHQLNEELEDKVLARTAELERARHEAETANQAKSSFLAAMSHEIRTPMNGVVGMIEVLHQTSLKGDQVEMINLIRESAFSLLGIINDILDFSKVEAGKLEIEQKTCVLADVVEGVCGLLDGMAEKKDVTLTLFIDPAIPTEVMTDTLRLRQVLINLVNNAIKFCSGQSHVRRVWVRVLLVERRPQQVTVEFRVADNGIGMDEATQARLFTAFTQADSSTTRVFGGTGLGLTIANHLVELMGGEITVQSAQGAGATFKVRLPLALPPEGSAVPEPPSAVAGLRCVVVGQQGGLADDLAAYLRHANAVVEWIPNLTSAEQQGVGRSGVSVWVVDAGDEPQSLEQMRAATRAEIDPAVCPVVVLVERGKRRRPRAAAHDLITVDGNVLSRRHFLNAVAAAGGRASLETEAANLISRRIALIAPSRAEAVRQGTLILIAEDNETNQKVLIRQLALLGRTADVAADGVEALQRWQGGEYALLLTDVHMPNMDGYALTQAIRADEKGVRRIPIIALTANVLKGEADHCRDVGMDDYRSKPIPLAELRAVLNQWLPVLRAGAVVSATGASLAPPPAPSVDVNVLKVLVGGDAAIVREFLQDFRSSAAAITLELRAACAARQMKAVADAGHKLKSSARAVGAMALSELCAAMEEVGKAGDRDALEVLLPRFEAEMAVVDAFIESG
jgi:PAS domain S-box-containing protein